MSPTHIQAGAVEVGGLDASEVELSVAGTAHVGVKITDLTDVHPILSVFQQYLRK